MSDEIKKKFKEELEMVEVFFREPEAEDLQPLLGKTSQFFEDRDYVVYFIEFSPEEEVDEDWSPYPLCYEDINVLRCWAEDSGMEAVIYKLEVPKEKMIADMRVVYRLGFGEVDLDPRRQMTNLNIYHLQDLKLATVEERIAEAD